MVRSFEEKKKSVRDLSIEREKTKEKYNKTKNRENPIFNGFCLEIVYFKQMYKEKTIQKKNLSYYFI